MFFFCIHTFIYVCCSQVRLIDKNLFCLPVSLLADIFWIWFICNYYAFALWQLSRVLLAHVSFLDCNFRSSADVERHVGLWFIQEIIPSFPCNDNENNFLYRIKYDKTLPKSIFIVIEHFKKFSHACKHKQIYYIWIMPSESF